MSQAADVSAQEEYDMALQNYNAVLQAVAGTGERANSFIKEPLERLNRARERLNQQPVSAPRITDDGACGAASGYAIAGCGLISKH